VTVSTSVRRRLLVPDSSDFSVGSPPEGLWPRGTNTGAMVLDRYRKAADWFLIPVASRLLHVNPNLVSWGALFAAVGAGIAFFFGGGGLLGLALLLILVNSYLDALDGKIAKMAGKASARG